MKTNFWQKLQPKADQPGAEKKPIFALAPMADVTDAAFRYIIAKYSKYGGQEIGKYGKFTPHLQASGGPDVMWTEFVSADGLMSPGRGILLNDLKFSEGERPIVAQLFSGNPEKMREASALCARLGFDGIDINMGCPDRSIEKQFAGAGLIKNPKLAKEIIQAAKSGANGLPVSVKTRIGYNKDEIDTWIQALLEEDIAALIVHVRTRKEMSKVVARWGDLSRIVAIRDKMKKETLIIGNGDLKDLNEAREKVQESGADGAMLGRAIFGNPFLFRNKNVPSSSERQSLPTTDEKLQIMVEHAKLFEKLLGQTKSFAIMKKHFKSYVSGFDGAKELRTELMEAENAEQVETIVKKFLKL
ncbi:MAG: tRNA-dihydrouridine synthase [bacterium]|nr:tRNA-dihydrouridine synthase [bacterium]